MDAVKQLAYGASNTTFDNTGFGVTLEKPRFPQYAVLAKRLESYKTWPEYLPHPPEILADAGLVYTGVGDSVRCYYCGGGLRNWDRDDDPWREHAKWYPSCPYLLLVKGDNYVRRVARGEKPENDGEMKSQTSKPPTEEDHLNSPAAQSCLENGFSKDVVKKAIQQYIIKTHGSTSFIGSDLCRIIFEQEEEDIKSTENIRARNVTDGSQAVVGSGTKVQEDTKENADAEDDVTELEEENRRLKERQQCKICLGERADIIFLPCGHMVSCPQCAPALVKCPLCRSAVKGYVKAYFTSMP